MNTRQWRNLMNAINNERCILLLGPAVASTKQNGNWQPLTQAFAHYLAKELDYEGITYDASMRDDLVYIMQRFMTIPGVLQTDPADEAKAFYQKNAFKANSILENLANLPFHLIINSTPDDLTAQAFKAAGKYQLQHTYYNFRKEDKNLVIPDFSKDKPLVYNLLGHYKDPDSLVLTESDRIKFVSNVVRNEPRIPVSITSEFDERKTYLFVGFNWDEWPLRLLLTSLNLGRSLAAYSPQTAIYKISPFAQEFFSAQFKFQFIDHHIEDFVVELQDKYTTTFVPVPQPLPSEPLNVFISYAKEDETYRDQLITNLALLEQKAYINIWHEGMIQFGQDKAEVIQQKLEDADLILLLVSADFLATDFSYAEHLALAYLRQRQDEVDIVPIIIRNSDWEQADFARFPLILPSGTYPVNSNFWNSPDDAYTDIVENLRSLIVQRLRVG